ncbi:MAG: crotonase, partial [Coxiella sp. (in: Bacteria)]
MTDYKHWHLEVDNDNILWLTFDREGMPVNSLSREVFSELDDIINTQVKEPPAGMAILSGKKKGFIAGADISQFTHLKTAD